MKTVTTKTLIALVIIINLLLINLSFFSLSETPVGLPPPNGDWVVADNTSINDTNLVVNGNLTITNAGSLNLTNVTLIMNGNITVEGNFILKNVTLIMNCTGPSNVSVAIYGIFVESTGLMYILDYDGDPATNDSSIITTGIKNGLHCYTFLVKSGSKFRMENSVLQECGLGFMTPGQSNIETKGLVIRTDNVQIKNSTFNCTKNGIIFDSKSSGNNSIYNCTFSLGKNIPSWLYGYYGITISNNDYNSIIKCKFYDIVNSIYFHYSNNNSVLDCMLGEPITYQYTKEDSIGIYCYYGDNNKFINITEDKVTLNIIIQGCRNSLIEDIAANNTYNSIIINGSSNYATLKNISITNVSYTGLLFRPPSGLYFKNEFSDITVVNCTITTRAYYNSEGIVFDRPNSADNLAFKNCTINTNGVPLVAYNFDLFNSYSISNVTVENSNFIGNEHAMAIINKLENWCFSNCSFKNSDEGSSSIGDGVVSIINEVNNLTYYNCGFKYIDTEQGVNGIEISNNYFNYKFDIELKNCIIEEATGNGILAHDKGRGLNGKLILDNCSIQGNDKTGLECKVKNVILDVENCYIINNTNHGILIQNPINSLINIRNSSILNNKNNGIIFNNADPNTKININHTNISGNMFNGLRTESSDCTLNILNSDFISNHQKGLEITDCTLNLNLSNITDNQKSGILLDNSVFNILNSIISTNLGSGLEIDNGKGNITNNQVLNNKNEEIKIENSLSNILIEDNLIISDSALGDSADLYIRNSEATVRNNTFTTTSSKVSNLGLKVYNCPSVLITENVFDGDFAQALIDLTFSNVQIENNQLLSCMPNCKGIYVNPETSGMIINNTITASGEYGIYLSPKTYTPIKFNNISGWSQGIMVDQTNAPIENNRMFQNDIGILISDTSVNIKNNTIFSTNICGIRVEDDAEAFITDNNFKFNYGSVSVYGFAHTYRNIISDSIYYGINIKNTGRTHLYDNTFLRNDIGILVNEGKLISMDNLLVANRIGFSFNNMSDGSMSDDVITDGDVGLKAEKSDLEINDYSFFKNTNAVTLMDSNFKFYNSSILGSDKNFILDDDSQCWVINTEMTDGLITVLDEISKLIRQWFLNISIIDLEGLPVPEIKVTIRNDDVSEVFNYTTSAIGTLNMLKLTSMSWWKNGALDPNPYEVILSKSGFGTVKYSLNFTNNTNSTFTALRLSDLITHVEAEDTPNDQGGSITLNWSHIPIINFGHYNIYVDTEFITSIDKLQPINNTILDQNLDSITISEIHGKPLVTGQEYYFAVVIVDSNERMDWRKVTCSNMVIPIDNLAPTPVIGPIAYDTPDDNGGSIIVSWNASTAPDFEYYTLYWFEGLSSIDNFLNLSTKIETTNIDETTITVSGLNDSSQYYFILLIFDINGNVNLSYDLIGPVTSLDNIPPQINRELSKPSLFERLNFNSSAREYFQVYLSTTEEVTYYWYLDRILLNDTQENFLLLTMSTLELGEHNITVVVEESSGLSDSVEWNFTVVKVPVSKSDKDNSTLVFFWVALVILILVLLPASLFSIQYVYRYNNARRIVKQLPTVSNNKAIEIINKKRAQGDRYTIGKLLTDLPNTMKSNPEKLFSILKTLALDDVSEIRVNAAKNIAKLLNRNPNMLFPWFKSLQELGVKPEIYLTIAQTVQNQQIKDISNAYFSNLTAKDETESSSRLENSAILYKRMEGFWFGLEMSIIYTTLSDFYKYRTVSKISTSRPTIERIKKLSGRTSGLLYPEVISVFEKMGSVAETLSKYEKVESVEDKLSYLSTSLNILENTSKFVRERLISPEKEQFVLVLNSWRNIITLNIKDLRGRSELNIELVGKELIIEEDRLTIMLELENIGRSVAEKIIVQVVPTDDYTILTGPQEIGVIGQKKKRSVSFEVRPRTDNAFRVEFRVQYDDAERTGKTVSFGDLISFIDVGAEFQDIPNPYVVGTPIKTGSELFVGRRDLINFIHKNIKGSLQENIIVLIGHRRTGKTTLLRQLPVFLDKSCIPIYIDIQGVIDPGMDAFFYLLATEITNAMQKYGIEIATPDFSNFEERPSFYFEYEFLKKVYEKLGNSVLVLMFDEFEELQVKVDSGLLDKNIFSYLRHLMQHSNKLAFIFTGTSRLEDLKTDYWSILFNIALYKRINFLTKGETKQLIIEPVKKYNMIYDSLAVEKIYRLTHGHPYFTQLLCHALVNLHNREKKNYITIQDVNGEINKIIERGQMHFDFIWDKTPLSERLVMTAMTRVFHEEEAITVSNIVNKLVEYNITVEARKVSKILDILSGKDIVLKIMDHTTTFEFKVDLIRIWLESSKNLDQVVEEFRAKS